LPSATIRACAACGTTGKPVKLITLKALLTPNALRSLEPGEAHHFCPHAECDVVYFGGSHSYGLGDVTVRVYQKDPGASVAVCACFGYTRAEVEIAVLDGHAEAVTSSIRQHIKAGRCGCEVNNPQGSCCLGNVTELITRRRAPTGP